MADTRAGLLGESLWQVCVDQLAQEIPEQQFSTWIRPLEAEVSEDLSKVTVKVANRFKLDWIRAQYAGRIVGLLEKVCGHSIALELALAPRDVQSSARVPASTNYNISSAEPMELFDREVIIHKI